MKQSGASKITKRGRDEYLLYMARGIQQPDEVWLEQRPGGASRLYYLARFQQKGKTLHTIAVFEQDASGFWKGITSYQTLRPAYFAEQRQEKNLIYRRVALSRA